MSEQKPDEKTAEVEGHMVVVRPLEEDDTPDVEGHVKVSGAERVSGPTSGPEKAR